MNVEDYAADEYNALRKVFSYLTGRELCNTSLVCRYWAIVAQDENFERGPIGMSLFLMEETLILHEIREAMIHLPIYPCLSMIMHTSPISINETEDCHCKDLQSDCYTISLRTATMSMFTSITGIHLPASPHIRINTCTLIRYSTASGIVYCPELRYFFCATYEFPLTLKTHIESILFNDSTWTSCMILLCDKRDFPLLANFVLSLSNWFPDKRISIWGGITSEIKICHTINSKRYCRVPVTLTCYFISSKNLQTWTMSWSPLSQTNAMIKEKLTNFKQRIKLKQHSLCLLFQPCFSSLCDCKLDINIYQEFFPDIPFFYMKNDAAIRGEEFEDVKKVINKWKYLRTHGPVVGGTEEIAIMILTY